MRKNSFNAISFCYDFLARLWFGKAIDESQAVFLHIIPENAKILIIGGGTGKILEEIAEMKKNVTIDYIENSSAMLKKAMERNMKADLVNFIYGDELRIAHENYYDVVVTYYFLDLFEKNRLESIVEKLYKSMKIEGICLVADFYLNKKSSLYQKWTIWLMYRFFKLFSNIEANHLILPDLIFMIHKLNKIEQRFFYGNLIRSMIWQKVEPGKCQKNDT